MAGVMLIRGGLERLLLAVFGRSPRAAADPKKSFSEG
jgi:hypothetical protein